VLEECHITFTDLKKEILKLRNEGKVIIKDFFPKARALKPYHVLQLPPI
jgi:hypothetical protein